MHHPFATRILFAATAACFTSLAATQAMGQVRVVDYNMHGYIGDDFHHNAPTYNNWVGTTTTPGVLRLMGSETLNGISVAPSILTLQEVYSGSTDPTQIASWMNEIYSTGGSSYSSTQRAAGSEDYAFVYDTSKVTLVDVTPVATPTRTSYRAHFQLNGYSGAGSDIYVYAVHAKAYSGYESTRAQTALSLMLNSNSLPAGSNVIYSGDYNFTTLSYTKVGGIAQGPADTSGEPGYGYMTNSAASANYAFDPAVGTGHSGQTSLSTGFALKNMTYSPTSFASRLDYQFASVALGDGNGMDVIGVNTASPSYATVGNANYSYSPYASIRSASDHAPIAMDLQVPAKMGVSVNSIASRVIVGSSLSATVNVSNTANVVASNGADELVYSITSSGSLSGSANGTAYALSSANVHTLALDTATTGHKTGTINVNSSSTAVANGTFSQNVAVDVLDHAHGSFSHDQLANHLTLDFGTISPTGSSLSGQFEIANLISVAGYTAALDLDSISIVGSNKFSTSLATFQNLAAGTYTTFDATFDASQLGLYTANITLNISDEDLPGAATSQLLLTLTGHVSGRAFGDFNDDGLVNGDDYTLWATNFGQSGTGNYADANADTLVNGDDYTVWASAYAASTGQSLTSILAQYSAVPEPGTLGLVGLGLFGLIGRRRRLIAE